MNNKKKALTAISIFALMMVMYMCWDLFEQIVLINIDDVMYSDWTKHGLQYFIDKNIWHYQNFNGRAFIHLMMQFVTFFDEHLYAILFPVFLGTVAYLFTTIIKRDWELHKRLFVVALTMMLFLGLSHLYLSQVLWIAGGFNYVFPLFVISIFYFLFLKYRHNANAMWGLLPLAFLCGATTEQCGMYTIGLITMTTLFDFIDTKKLPVKNVAYFVVSVGGLLSVFLSPATFTRFGNSNDKMASKGLSFIDGYLNNFDFIGGRHGSIMLPIMFMLIVGICAFVCKDKYNKWLKLGVPFAVVAFFPSLVGFYYVSALLSIVLIVFLIVTTAINKETRELSKLLICGYGTFFMMSITLGAGSRTCIPCILSLIIAVSIMFVDMVLTVKKKIGITVLLSILLLSSLNNYWTTYDGYKAKGVWGQGMYDQLMTSSETGKLEIYFDELIAGTEPKYRYVTMFDVADRNQFSIYQEKFDIPDSVRLNFTSDKFDVSSVCVDGRYILLPAIHQCGKVYISVRAGQEKDMGVDVNESENTDKVKIICGDGEDIIECTPDDYIGITLYNGEQCFIDINLLCEHYGLQYTYDSTENTYIFTKTN